GATAQQLVGLLATVAAEIFLQQVHHRPEMAAFLDIDLEQVAQVIERGRGLRRAPPARPARHNARRTESCGSPPAAPAGCPSDSRASSHSRTWPSRGD